MSPGDAVSLALLGLDRPSTPVEIAEYLRGFGEFFSGSYLSRYLYEHDHCAKARRVKRRFVRFQGDRWGIGGGNC